MPEFVMPGEPLTQAYPAAVEEVTFEGVVVSRLVGTQTQIMQTTTMMKAFFPKETHRMDTLNDAKWLGHAQSISETGRKSVVEIYELIVMRKAVKNGS